MNATHPEQLTALFAQSFNNRDLDDLVNLFTADAVFLLQPGQPVTGDGIRSALQAFLALNAPIKITVRQAIIVGTVAQIIADWSLTGVDAEGAPIAPGRHNGRCRAARLRWHVALPHR